MSREPFTTRRILLVGEQQKAGAIATLTHAPLDEFEPLEFLVREQVKTRKLSANAAMWAGPLKDIAEQAYLAGRKYSELVWHEYFKGQFLPDESAPDFDPSHVKEGYRKYDFDPAGDRVLVGSTTELTRKGFAIYRLQLEAFGANLGVMFSAGPRGEA